MVSVDDVVVSVGSEGWNAVGGIDNKTVIIAGIGVIAAVQQHQEAKGHHAGDDPHC